MSELEFLNRKIAFSGISLRKLSKSLGINYNKMYSHLSGGCKDTDAVSKTIVKVERFVNKKLDEQGLVCKIIQE